MNKTVLIPQPAKCITVFLPEFTQMLELAFEGENCSFMDRNSCHPAGSVFLTFLGTNERKVASLAPDAFDTGLQVRPCLWTSALPVGLLLDSPVAVQSVYSLQPLWREYFYLAFKDSGLLVTTVATHCL